MIQIETANSEIVHLTLNIVNIHFNLFPATLALGNLNWTYSLKQKNGAAITYKFYLPI